VNFLNEDRVRRDLKGDFCNLKENKRTEGFGNFLIGYNCFPGFLQKKVFPQNQFGVTE